MCCVLSHVTLFATPWTVAHKAPLSMELPRQEYWSGLPFPSPGDLPGLEIKPTSVVSLTLAGRLFYLWATKEALKYIGRPKYKLTCSNFHFSVSTRETLDDSVKPDFLQVHQTKLSFTKSISKFKLVHHQNHLWLTFRESEELIDHHNTVKAVTHKI